MGETNISRSAQSSPIRESCTGSVAGLWWSMVSSSSSSNAAAVTPVLTRFQFPRSTEGWRDGPNSLIFFLVCAPSFSISFIFLFPRLLMCTHIFFLSASDGEVFNWTWTSRRLTAASWRLHLSSAAHMALATDGRATALLSRQYIQDRVSYNILCPCPNVALFSNISRGTKQSFGSAQLHQISRSLPALSISSAGQRIVMSWSA